MRTAAQTDVPLGLLGEWLLPGELAAGTQKSPNGKGKSFEPNLHFWVQKECSIIGFY